VDLLGCYVTGCYVTGCYVTSFYNSVVSGFLWLWIPTMVIVARAGGRIANEIYSIQLAEPEF